MPQGNLSGQTFNYLTLERQTALRGPNGRMLYLCKCVCGAYPLFLDGNKIKHGCITSCGCMRYKKDAIYKLPEFTIWQSMKSRCYLPSNPLYPLYGGRGITVCDEWRDDFRAFYAYIGPRPSPKHSIDRYPDNNAGYQPGNVRWATWTEQQRNRRSNTFYTINGETKCLTEWCQEKNIKLNTVISRMLTGMSFEKALNMPVQSHREVANRPEHKAKLRESTSTWWNSMTIDEQAAHVRKMQANNPNHQKVSPRRKQREEKTLKQNT